MTGTPAAASGASRTACERMVTIAVYSSTSAIAPGGPGRCPGKLQSRTTSDRAPIASACRIGTLATRPVTPAARARRYPGWRARQQRRQQVPLAQNMREGGGAVHGHRRERQGQIRERDVSAQESGNDRGEPGAGEQVRPGALQGARLCEQAAGEYVPARQARPQVGQAVRRALRVRGNDRAVERPYRAPGHDAGNDLTLAERLKHPHLHRAAAKHVSHGAGKVRNIHVCPPPVTRTPKSRTGTAVTWCCRISPNSGSAGRAERPASPRSTSPATSSAGGSPGWPGAGGTGTAPAPSWPAPPASFTTWR